MTCEAEKQAYEEAYDRLHEAAKEYDSADSAVWHAHLENFGAHLFGGEHNAITEEMAEAMQNLVDAENRFSEADKDVEKAEDDFHAAFEEMLDCIKGG